MNICFASDKNGLKNLTLDSVQGFYEVYMPLPEYVDILVINGDSDVSEYVNRNIDTCIFDSSYAMKVLELKNVNSAISCGMQDIDSVTFSSIFAHRFFNKSKRRIIWNRSEYADLICVKAYSGILRSRL